MADILIATHNQNKKKEIRMILKGVKNVKILTLDDLPFNAPQIIEDGKTFRQNSVKKALTLSRFFDGLVLADDSGLEVDALDGKPGVRSARFARKNAADKENNDKLLKLMYNVPEKKRQASFVCNIALAEKGILKGTFEGKVKGRILFEPKGKSGFGYDPLFVPKGEDKTYAQMAQSYKNQISHRAEALKKLQRSIGKFVNQT